MTGFQTAYLGALTVVSTLACGTAHADRIARPQSSVLLPARGGSASYSVELTDAWGRQLPTYTRRGRFYALGGQGNRYSIRVRNPTSRRIEAVVSVDGLDVIDGKSASTTKRGYVVLPYDSITIEGFRTSTSRVASFRFSSVANSYAGRKGKARNVGVIGVAIFEEKGEVMVPTRPHHHHHNDDYRDYLYDREEHAGRRRSRGNQKSAKRHPSGEDAPSQPRVGGARKSKAPAASADEGSIARGMAEPRDRSHSKNRPGLGTEFGEGRYSAVTWTRFRRRTKRPAVVTQLRYNDASGLAALGILVQSRWDDEIATRESANPFPSRFSAPPPDVR